MNIEGVLGIIERARVHGVGLWTEGSRLHLRAAGGSVDNELTTQLNLHKKDIVAVLSEPAFSPCGQARRTPFLPSMLRFWKEVQIGQTPVAVANGTHFATKWTGEFNLTAMQQSLESIASRHWILCAQVVEPGGLPEFFCPESPARAVEIVDLSCRTRADDDQEEEVKSVLEELLWKPFEPEGPLFRSFVMRVSDSEHIVGFVIHHFIGDWRSVAIAGSELLQGYDHYCGRSGAPRNPSLQYSDYLSAMREWLNGPAAEYRLAYWKRIMASAPCSRLPPDDDIAADAIGKIEHVSFELQTLLVTRTRELARCRSATVFTVVLTAQIVAFATLSDSSDVVFRIVVSGRENPRLIGMIGHTISFLPVRISVSMDMTFAGLMDQAKQASAAACSLWFPWESLETALGDVNASDVSPLINFINARAVRSSHPKMSRGIEPVRAPAPPVRKDKLAAHETRIVDDGVSVRGSVLYLADRYRRQSIVRFVNLFLEVLERASEAPDKPLGSVTAGML